MLFDDWDNQVRDYVGRLRALAATEPDAPDLASIVGDILVKRPAFARMWDRYDVRGHSYGRKTFHLPQVCDLTPGLPDYEPGRRIDQNLMIYYAEPVPQSTTPLLLPADLGAHDGALHTPARQDTGILTLARQMG
jgi:hypothetical protein